MTMAPMIHGQVVPEEAPRRPTTAGRGGPPETRRSPWPRGGTGGLNLQQLRPTQPVHRPSSLRRWALRPRPPPLLLASRGRVPPPFYRKEDHHGSPHSSPKRTLEAVHEWARNAPELDEELQCTLSWSVVLTPTLPAGPRKPECYRGTPPHEAGFPGVGTMNLEECGGAMDVGGRNREGPVRADPRKMHPLPELDAKPKDLGRGPAAQRHLWRLVRPGSFPKPRSHPGTGPFPMVLQSFPKERSQWRVLFPPNNFRSPGAPWWPC